MTMDHTMDLLRRLAVDDPITHSMEGLDDECLFCGTYNRTKDADGFNAGWLHRHDCPWIEARQLLGLDLGNNTVEPE
jgi:hypothetical protein